MNMMWVLLALICMAAPAMALEPTTPFVIDGYVNNSGNNPCENSAVQVTNATGESWDADNSSASNYYRCVLDSDDVGVDDTLQLKASGCSESNTTEHNVTESEIEGGGFAFDTMLGPDGPPVPEMASIALVAVGLVMLLGWMRFGRKD